MIAIENLIRINQTLIENFFRTLMVPYRLPFPSKPNQLPQRIDIPYRPAPE